MNKTPHDNTKPPIIPNNKSLYNVLFEIELDISGSSDTLIQKLYFLRSAAVRPT